MNSATQTPEITNMDTGQEMNLNHNHMIQTTKGAVP